MSSHVGPPPRHADRSISCGSTTRPSRWTSRPRPHARRGTRRSRSAYPTSARQRRPSVRPRYERAFFFLNDLGACRRRAPRSRADPSIGTASAEYGPPHRSRCGPAAGRGSPTARQRPARFRSVLVAHSALHRARRLRAGRVRGPEWRWQLQALSRARHLQRRRRSADWCWRLLGGVPTANAEGLDRIGGWRRMSPTYPQIDTARLSSSSACPEILEKRSRRHAPRYWKKERARPRFPACAGTATRPIKLWPM